MNINLNKNNKSYEENSDNKIKEVNQIINFIKQQIDQDKKKEKIKLIFQLKKLKINLISFMMFYQQKKKEETQSKMYRMIEDIHEKIQEELQTERQQRESTTDSLIKLLEETCQKIDKGFK
ncbi:hypothetical protein IMG5_110270 [Ichthyophthirius multifiliis]|uniref:Uncharacterized protein n=1 Tax=Ichthyophthirius multifiliis TaxID=5932 RepID=G0QTN8_ICHMU|nr:hypothetical protein IMG5_110270 [Ichthyophthirius multifiliis]EGR31411.1 hypothetical protein IMG5_110270 [Ichthyophthirius multifiliis]|eukprot:XP_004034897.1 hypothetical protein IMG5_110270 [Ichthyophthirius multifiliis]